ncbi:glycosyltransferase [Roseibacterium sp. SDUM158016]|uniref:glycosyltransferase family 4 protein n=1 Tax=Roseicyclus sediminis TaxID=2980997 RepID=UPI0021D2E4B8|nr:glycosyltransferase [Roseibacterium sp. SDUM158016]MCU4653761.1 glycosyltransferase [Roseibacterium sp. SDUM158016]
MNDRRAKVLIIAYACRPGESSERQVGWHWSRLIQQNHDVTVLTRETHRRHIEAWIAGGKEEGPFPEFLYYDLPPWLAKFKKGERGLYLYYTLWTLLAVLWCRRLNRDGRWEITHFLTFGTLLWPQFGFLMNTRYLLGPVGGGERVPLALRGSFATAGQLKILVRHLVQRLMLVNPVFLANLSRADLILARTEETLDMIPSRYRHKTELLLETAIGPDMLLQSAPERANATLRIVSVGRLITSKFNPLLLEALAEFKERWKRPFRMTIIGDGPERARLEVLRDRLGLTEVDFVGSKTSKEVYEELRASDIYFSTTMKEGGTWAFFEAIAHHLPVVCLKVNGPDMIVGDGCGIKVPAVSHAAARSQLADGLLQLAGSPDLRSKFARDALSHLETNYTWDRVAQTIDRVYAGLLARPRQDDRFPAQ